MYEPTTAMKIETKKGLWVSSSFTDKFGNEEIKPAKTILPFKVLPRSMSDSEIKKEFGIEESTLEDVAAFLENPPKGTNDGHWNIFYVAGCVVRARWNSDSQKWVVYAWELGDGRWRAGRRAFGRNSLSESGVFDALTLASLATRVAKLEAFYDRAIELISSFESPETI